MGCCSLSFGEGWGEVAVQAPFGGLGAKKNTHTGDLTLSC